MIYVVALRRKCSMKAVALLLICLSAFILFGNNLFNVIYNTEYTELDPKDISIKVHIASVDNYFERRTVWPTSRLGGILFNREEIPLINHNANRTYVVLMWKYWDWLKKRHVYNFGNNKDKEDNILEGCSVTNCIFSGDDKLIDTADAVLIHLQRGLIPEVEKRNPKQRWIFLNDESAIHAFSLAAAKPNLEKFYNVFNWSMTYRSDADVPVPYGRTLALDKPYMKSLDLTEVATLVPNWDRKQADIPATVLMSNCGVKDRNDFVAELKKHIKVDVYGQCSDKDAFKVSCPGHFKADCDPVAKYMFYLVLENSHCFQYLTEKVFYHAYSKGAVPIIWGPSSNDAETLLPPNSYLYADKNTDLAQLAETIKTLTENRDLLLSMHMWRNNFKIVNEHAYFGTKSYHLCRLCEALNYNDEKEKIYDKERIEWFLDPSKSCF